MKRAALVLMLLAVAPAAAAPPMKGVGLGAYHRGGETPWKFDDLLAEIRAIGANTVSVPVFWRQRDVADAEVSRGDEQLTIPDDDLRRLVRAAHASGLRVMLFPIIEVEQRARGQWRGTLAPADRRRWWESYEAFVLHYARIAADEKVAVLSIGSELGSTEGWRDEWFHLCAAVEKVYRGELLYSANWDHYDKVSFWERVDLVGISAYFELTADREASEDALASAWAAPRRALSAAAARAGKPLVLAEIGWPSLDGGAVHPWDYTRDAAVDLEEQRRAYRAFVRAWSDEPSLVGVFFWSWTADGGAEDRGYSPRGKPAETVLRSWYRRGD
jgi:hypothetical protein